MVLHGLSVQARDGVSAARLLQGVALAMQVFPGSAPGR